MIKAIKQFFENHIAIDPSDTNADPKRALQVACGALLLEIARADFHIKSDELAAVADALQRKFSLSERETNALMALAEQEAAAAVSDYEFTSLIHKHFSIPQKINLLELMWEVAYADNVLQKYEEALIRKIADLLYISHADYIAAKHRVLNDKA